MKRMPVVRRRQALDDIAAAITYYVNQGAERTALAFIDAIEQAFPASAYTPKLDRRATRKNSA